MHPASGPFGIADAAPMAIFGGDFKRHGAAGEHPVDAMG